MKALLCAAMALVLAVGSFPAAADGADDIEKLLQARWYEVEIIVFERLDVLDVNSPEQLTQRRPRRWPHNLLDIDTPLQADDSQQAAAYCLGYPLLAEEDPAHPLLLPRQEPPLPDADEMLRRAAVNQPAAEVTDEIAEPEDVPPQAQPALELQTPQLTMTPYLQFLADVAAFEASLYDTSYTWLEELTMMPYVKAINRQSHLRPLVHRRWRAPIPQRNQPQPVYIASESDEAAPRTRAGFAKLEGFVDVTVGRYLHFAPTLWYHADNLGMSPIALPTLDALPLPDTSGYMELRQSRRLRSGDLHYLDHPKFGVIVRIDPVAIPAHLMQAWEALESSE
jgi:hypothetical protein